MEAMKKVTETEQQAQSKREAAVLEGRQALVAAQREGERLLEQARQDADAQAKEVMVRAEERAAEEAKVILAAAETDNEAFRQKARQRLDEAAGFIAERVVNN